MFISVVIPTHNKCEILLQTLQRLQTQTISSECYEIIVVDNNCTDNTEQIVKKFSGSGLVDIQYISELREGRGAARNAGIHLARGDVILFMDDDILVKPDHLKQHLLCHNGDPLAVMGRIRDVSKYSPAILGEYMLGKQFAGVWVNFDSAINLKDVPGLSVATGNLSVSRSALELVAFSSVNEERSSYFNETLLSRQDADLGVRLQSKGVKIKVKEIWCEHNHPRDWRGCQERSQRSGYWARIMMQKYPDLTKPPKHIYPLPFAYGLLFVAACVSPFAMMFFSFWRLPLFKCIGIWGAFETNRGYWRAEREVRNK